MSKVTFRGLSRYIMVVAILFMSYDLPAIDLKVLSGNGSKPAVMEICQEFEKLTGHHIQLDFAVNPHVRQRVDDGEYVDVVILNPPVLDQLIKSQSIKSETKVMIGRIGLGAAIRSGAPRPKIATPQEFKDALLNINSVAYPSDGASGKYFVSLLGRMGIEQPMQSKLRPMSGEYNVEGVAKGEVDMIVVVASRIYGVPGVDFLGLIPNELQTWIEFSAGVSQGSTHQEESTQLTEFFRGPKALEILKKIGIETSYP